MSGQAIHNIPALNSGDGNCGRILQLQRLYSGKTCRVHVWMGRSFVDRSIGKYVLDFYCPECRLAVELDGEAHFTSIRAGYDVARDEFIRSLKIRTVRFENRLVFEDLEDVLETIKEHLK